MKMQRRKFIQTLCLGAIGIHDIAWTAAQPALRHRVVIIDCDYSCATAATDLYSRNTDTIVLKPVDVIFGGEQLCDQTYTIDAENNCVQVANGQCLTYDFLIIAPGAAFAWEQLPDITLPLPQDKALSVISGWKVNPQTNALNQQFQAMPDNSLVMMTLPQLAPHCLPASRGRARKEAYNINLIIHKGRISNELKGRILFAASAYVATGELRPHP